MSGGCFITFLRREFRTNSFDTNPLYFPKIYLPRIRKPGLRLTKLKIPIYFVIQSTFYIFEFSNNLNSKLLSNETENI